MFVFRTIAILLLAVLASASPLKRARDALSEQSGSTPKDFLVTKLPGLFQNFATDDVPLMHAGQLKLYTENNTHYFFWKFEDSTKLPQAQNKTIFWLNGGPGCLSMDGALMEAGPLRINDKKEVVPNDGSWHKQADIIFVDQPANTGFSYSNDFDSELDEVLWHFMRFLDKYFELFPGELHNQIMLAGESYAGQYIPYIARALVERNKRLAKDGESGLEHIYNLTGLLIGNGWISPNEQGLSYVPYAIQAGMISTDHPHWFDVLAVHQKCQTAVDHANADDSAQAYAVVSRECDQVLTKLLYYTVDGAAPKDQQCFNMYDYTLKDSYPSCGMNWPPDLANVNPFLRSEEVMLDLNLEVHKLWHECSGSVGSHLRAKKSYPAIKFFPDLLKELEIVLFHGNRDIICNYIGAEDMIKRLDWGGQKGYTPDLPVYDWVHNGTVHGYVKTERNLTFINVFDASHMVPFDQPEVSRAVVDILFKRYDLESNEGEKPKLVTMPVGYKKEDSSKTEPEPAKESSTLEVSPVDSDTAQASSLPSADQTHSSRIVRLIQLAVIIVLIWGVCALYSTYKSKPASIIKTKASSGRKKNVQWADQLEDQPGAEQPQGFISKAFNKFKRPDSRGIYAPVDLEDIELGENVGQVEDNFIISSDDERDSAPAEQAPKPTPKS